MDPRLVWLAWALFFGATAGAIELHALHTKRKGDTLTEAIQSVSPHKVLATVVFGLAAVSGAAVLAWHLWWS